MIEFALQIINRCEDTIATAKKCRKKKNIVANMIIAELEECIRFTQTQCSLAHRRVILGEKVPHDAKVFSYFEPHTELINRGKSPYPIEFGHRVLIIQDRAEFILKYLVMEHTTDDKVLIPAMKDLQEQYGGKIISASFDKGLMKRDFVKAMEKREIDSTHFFVDRAPGRKHDENKAKVKDRIIELRKQNRSILDIKSILHAEGNMISHDYIHRVLVSEGFARLSKRTQIERKCSSSKVIKAPKSKSIDWVMDEGKTFHSERGVGILSFLPLLAELNVDRWIESAGYPQTSELNRVQNVLCFVALKLAEHNKYSQDDIWAMDRGFGLFSGLNVLPKDSTLSSYSYRTTRSMNRKFLKAMYQSLDKLGFLSGKVNMDFTTIPHWGDASILENNWSAKRGKALKSILAALCQDPDKGYFVILMLKSSIISNLRVYWSLLIFGRRMVKVLPV